MLNNNNHKKQIQQQPLQMLNAQCSTQQQPLQTVNAQSPMPNAKTQSTKKVTTTHQRNTRKSNSNTRAIIPVQVNLPHEKHHTRTTQTQRIINPQSTTKVTTTNKGNITQLQQVQTPQVQKTNYMKLKISHHTAATRSTHHTPKMNTSPVRCNIS